jgi:hypothetical protein
MTETALIKIWQKKSASNGVTLKPSETVLWRLLHGSEKYSYTYPWADSE